MADPIDAAPARPDRAALEAEIRRLERLSDAGAPARAVTLGCEAVDAHLPDGLVLARVHELVGEARSEVRDAAVFGFACALLAKISSERSTILWCARRANLFGGAVYARGLATLGLDPGRVVFVDAEDEADRLRAMEEGLSTPGLAAVVGEFDPPRRGDVTASRRLQLAAEKSGVSGLILRPRLTTAAGTGERVTLAVETRWRVTSAPSPLVLGDDRPVWDIALERARRGRPGRWRLAWDAATGWLEELRLEELRPEELRPEATGTVAATPAALARIGHEEEAA